MIGVRLRQRAFLGLDPGKGGGKFLIAHV